MPVTPVHGKKAFFALADAAAPGTVTEATEPTDGVGGGGDNITDWLYEIGFPRSADEVEVTTFGPEEYKAFISGFKDATINLSGRWDAIIDGRMSGILGLDGGVGFVFGPEGNAVGKVRYSGSVVCTSFEMSPSVGDVQNWTSTLRIRTAPTRGAF